MINKLKNVFAYSCSSCWINGPVEGYRQVRNVQVTWPGLHLIYMNINKWQPLGLSFIVKNLFSKRKDQCTDNMPELVGSVARKYVLPVHRYLLGSGWGRYERNIGECYTLFLKKSPIIINSPICFHLNHMVIRGTPSKSKNQRGTYLNLELCIIAKNIAIYLVTQSL
jgi:hypothetical protein